MFSTFASGYYWPDFSCFGKWQCNGWDLFLAFETAQFLYYDEPYAV